MLKLFVAAVLLLQFEVASVRPSNPQQEPGNVLSAFGSFRTLPNGIVIQNADLLSIILWAHDIDAAGASSQVDYSKFSGKESILGRRFDIEARGMGDMKAMLRTLLAERFGLRTHVEQREVELYALRTKEPRKLRATTANCNQWRRAAAETRGPRPKPCETSALQFTLVGGSLQQKSAGTIADLVKIAMGHLRVPVKDETGLQGNFEWDFRYAPRGDADSLAPTLDEAFEDALGLKLERTRGPWEVFVIDDVRMPTPN